MAKSLVPLLLLAAAAGGQQPTCLAYEADTVSLSGRLVRRVYPGRPNYESIRAGDEPDTVFVLRLRKPICLTQSGIYEAKSDVREIQLFLTEEDAGRARKLIGRDIELSGVLRGAEWGWHHLPVVFWAKLPTPARRQVASSVVELRAPVSR